MHTYIAVAAAVAVFSFVFFGGRVFPQLYILDMLNSNVFSAQDAARGALGSGNTSGSGGVELSGVGGVVTDESAAFDVSLLTSALADLPDPVSVFEIEGGTGVEAVESSVVSVGYRGTFIDEQTGEEVLFDENIDPASPLTFTLGSEGIISGFNIGVAGMREGGTRLVVIRPEMGYGSQRVGVIPPNTTLIFVIELYEVR